MGHGGKGANQAVSARRLGGNVMFVCKVGKDLFGEDSVRSYEREGLDISRIMFSGKPSGVALINVDADAENSITVASGANMDFTPEDVRQLDDAVAASSVVLLQLEIPVETVLEAARMACAAGKYVVLNPAPACSLPEELYGLSEFSVESGYRQAKAILEKNSDLYVYSVIQAVQCIFIY